MANLTLSLDDEILQKAREAALREGTSVNAVVREFLTHYADTRARRVEALDTLDAHELALAEQLAWFDALIAEAALRSL